MGWQFWKREQTETRAAEVSFSDAFARSLLDSAERADGDHDTAMEEAVAGLWARAFASATVTPVTAATMALTPSVLAMVGRELYECGESVFEISVMGGMVQLNPASDWDVRGGRDWTYRLNIQHPDSFSTVYRPSMSVLHFRYGSDPERPWEGRAPQSRASTTSDLLNNLEERMKWGASGPVGDLVTVPAVTDEFQRDIKALKGQSTLVESTAAGWDEGEAAQQRPEYKRVQLGPDYPESLEKTRQGTGEHVAAAGGVPPAYFRADGEGTAKREAYRQFLVGTIVPVAKIVSHELRYKLDVPDLELDFTELQAADIQARAKGFQAMVAGGMEVERAAILSGLMAEDSD